MVPTARQHYIFCARGPDPDMRNVPGGETVERDCMGAHCGELTAARLGWAVSPAATEGGAAAAVADEAAEPLSEPRASEHKACSHTGVCEVRIC